MSLIEIEGLEHTYLEGTPFASRVLRGVDLAVEEGELLGVVGPSQSGKSTMAQFCNGLLRPRRGRVVVDGVDTGARGADLRELRRRVGLVFQYPEHQLFAETVGDDVAFGPRNIGVPKAALAARVDAALEAVSLDPATFRDRYVHTLSGGQKRRAAIAGVLALEPAVLILDDPIAGLDPRGRDGILGWIAELHRRGGLTTVLISNSLEEIAPLLQRVAVMAAGRVVTAGTPAEVFGDPEVLRRVGLGVLPTVELMGALQARGLDVPLD
nr:energy-coupling factor transporter ATPase [Euzebyales bacterium]